MKIRKENLEELLSSKPEFLRSHDLIAMGLYNSFSDVCLSKKRGFSPPSIRLSPRKIVYPKNMVLEWLHKKSLLDAEAKSKTLVEETV